MYSTVHDLPSEVRNSLNDSDAEVWMRVYCAHDPQTEDEVAKAKEDAWRACKDLPSSFSFHAIATLEDFDREREIIDVPTLMRSMKRYIRSGGPMQYNHGNYQVGVVWGYEPMVKDGRKGVAIWGNLFGGDGGVYDRVRREFVRGTHSVSVGGTTESLRHECHEGSCGTRRMVDELMEISLCKIPSNKHAVLLSYNDNAIRKSNDGIRFTDVEMHRDESSCPTLRLRRELRDLGIDAHGRTDGVFVPMDDIGFVRSVGCMRQGGLCVRRVEGGVLLNERDTLLERTFAKGIDDGSLDADGVFVRTDTGTFYRAMDDGLVEYMDERYRLCDPSDTDMI